MNNPLRFTKMHGLGNDFIVIDAVRQSVSLSSKDIITLAERFTGIGFDQCLLIEPSRESGIDFFYRIFNADGQEVGQCGNGARCLARFAYNYGLTEKTRITVATKTTRMELEINSDETVTVNFGIPKRLPKDIPLLAADLSPVYQLPLANGVSHAVHAINVGNPHAVTVVNHLAHTPVETLGKEISEHSQFPEQVNAGFMEIIDKHHIKLRVFERGCGETQACGSGAVAAAAIGKLFHHLETPITISLPGGNLHVEWANEESPIFLRGPASFVYEGVLCKNP